MLRHVPKSGSPDRGRRSLATGIAAMLLAALPAGDAAAQDVNGRRPDAPLAGFTPRLPPPPRTFIEELSANSAIIEVKIGQGRFLTLKENLSAPGQPAPFIAVGDPSVLDFFQPGLRQLRLIGKKLGTTDLTVTTSSGRTYDFEIQVVADLDVLRAQLRQLFPDASLKVAQLREKVVVEGQARDSAQVGRIVAVVDTYIRSVQRVQISGQVGDVQNIAGANPDLPPPLPRPAAEALAPNPGLLPPGATSGFVPAGPAAGTGMAPASPGVVTAGQIATNQSQVINLLRVPTSQQVLLKVRVAELNRTGLRQIGADFLASFPQFGSLFGTEIAGNGFAAGRVGNTTFPNGRRGVGGDIRDLNLGSQATAFGTFSHGAFSSILTALRRNNLVKILAEPNLVALNGHQASFLAGGEFPVPSFSGVGAGSGVGGTSSTQFKEFGVRLAFLPLIQDNETIRLTVDPEVSTVDFSVATTLVPGGSPVPGLNVRKSHTTVDLRQGETLAIAGLMQLELDGSTQRIPGLGDLPYIGAFFSNTTSNRVEKELVVLVTPYIVEPMPQGQVPPTPGDEVRQPNDLEFFFLNRIEGRTGVDTRSTTNYDDPLRLIRNSIVERKYLIGPSGYSK